MFSLFSSLIAMRHNNLFSEQERFLAHLTQAKKRVNCLDRLRIQRALAANEENFKQVFLLLPLLLHCNHPNLPTYIENAPHGIAQFNLSAFQRNFLHQHHLNEKHFLHTPIFDGLYVMGSIGSISQTPDSDLDLWLCHHNHFSPQQYYLIEQKLNALTFWAKSFGIDIHFYLMNPKDFKQHRLRNISAEHSGSAQHYTLLEEFYRSAIRLAGKRLLWWHIQEEKESYSQTIKKAQKNGWINLDEWIDFGDISTLSLDEYFGATLWQLYKGIRSPYKSALKILLLESYAQTYPKTEFIAQQFKKKLLTNTTRYHFDPYLAMLEQVSSYLSQRKELNRLDLVRCSFYIKANNGVKAGSWREKRLSELTTQWQWTPRELAILNEHRHWKVKQAMLQHKLVVEQLLASYRHLIQFARKMQLNPSILPSDTDILMRQLYSAFEKLPDKIDLINPQVSNQLAEAHITFVEVQNSIATKSGWYLINQAPKSEYDSVSRYVHFEKNLDKLIAWAYFNGLLTASTQLHLISKNLEIASLHHFITDLRLSFMRQPPPLSQYDLYHPHEIRSLSVIVNLEKDPSRKISLWQRNISVKELLNLNHSLQNPIGSIGLIYRNLWNEIRVQHFEGNNALLNAVKFISNKICRNASPPRVINVHCYSRYLRSELRDTIAELVNKCINVQTGTVFQKQQLSYAKFGNKLKDKCFQNILNLSSPKHEKKLTQPLPPFPREIDEFACEGFLQFFFEDNKDGSFNLYILDEKNHLESYYHCTDTKSEKVKQIYHHHSQQQHKNNDESFNFPQFYQLLKMPNKIEIVPFQSKQHREYIAHH